jgi:MFS family permease
MSLPVFKTIGRNIQFVGREWPVIWHFLQVPLLLTVLVGCLIVAIVLATDTQTLFVLQPEDKKNPISLTVWYFVLQFVAGYGLSFLLVCFYISLIRYMAGGRQAVENRPRWALKKAEWALIGRTLLFSIYCLGLFLGIALGVFLIFFAGQFIYRNVPPSSLREIIFIVPASIAGVVGYFWLIGALMRLSISLIPSAIGAPLQIWRAWRATKGLTWKFVGLATTIGIIILIPILIITFFVTPNMLGEVPTPETITTFLKFQILQPLLFSPFSIVMGIIWCGIFVNVWQLPEGRAEWPLPDFPLLELPADPVAEQQL